MDACNRGHETEGDECGRWPAVFKGKYGIVERCEVDSIRQSEAIKEAESASSV